MNESSMILKLAAIEEEEDEVGPDGVGGTCNCVLEGNIDAEVEAMALREEDG